MSAQFSDYRVLSINRKCLQNCSYCVEDIKTGRLFVWDALDYGLLSINGKQILLEEVSKLSSSNHPHLVQCVNHVDHEPTGTLYLVKEYCGGSVAALIKKCQSTNSFVDEDFIWKVVYQTARAAQAMYSRGPRSAILDITTNGVHLNEGGDVKLDYWLNFRETDVERRSRRTDGSSKDGSERRQKKTDSYALGQLVCSMATLSQLSRTGDSSTMVVSDLPPHYSQQLQTIVDLMLVPDQDKRLTIEAVLYHPSLLSHVVTSSIQHLCLKPSQDKALSSNKSNVTQCARCKELEEKLTVMRSREANIRAREMDLKEKERTAVRKSKHIAMMEQLVKEKLDKAEIYLTQARKNKPPDDLDSSCYSADPGDSYLTATAAKLDPNRIIRPPSLAPSVRSRMSVRFEPIPEFAETENAQNPQIQWLENKRNLYKAARAKYKVSKSSRNRDKENLPPKSDKMRASAVSLAHNTKESQGGLLETVFL